MDEQFVANLRSRLEGEPVPSPYASFLSTRYLIVGVLTLALLLPIGYYASNKTQTSSAIFAMDQEVQPLPGKAYGAIEMQDSGRGGGARNAVSSPTASNPEVATMSSASAGSAPAPAKDARMMLPNGPITTYAYVYKGEPLELQSEGLVYNHTHTEKSSGQIASQLRKFNFGLINLGAYSDARVRAFELVQDKPFGYSINVNFDEGTININPNYTEWPSLVAKDGQSAQLPKSAMPKNDEVLAIAKAFLDEHDIKLTNYADPIVQAYAQMDPADTQMQYAPEQITVTYPLKIQGTEVIEDGAYPYGLQVGVSVRDKRVMSVYGLTSQTYTSSSYQLETDSDKILSILGRGGPHAWIPEETTGITVKKVDIEVGTPKKVLMHTYSYANGESKELFVPALDFPVTKAPDNAQYYPKNIVIPLLPELLTEQSGPVMYDTVR